MPEHYSFDVWNTLILPDPKFAPMRRLFLGTLLGVTSEQAETGYRYIKTLSDHRAETLGEGLSCADTYRKLLNHLEISKDYLPSLRQGFEDLFLLYPPKPISGLAEALQQLQARGATLSIASNTNFIGGALLKRAVLQQLGVRWCFQLFSDELCLSKPHPEVWKMLSSKVPAGTRITHVGDNDICDGSCTKASRIEYVNVKNPTDTLSFLENIHVPS